MQCDMCGRSTKLLKTKIEGSSMNVCQSCSVHGTILRQEPKVFPKPKFLQDSAPEIIQMIVDNYPSLVRNKRELLKIKQEELAKRIAEKESVIHKIETGTLKPSLDLAIKLERFLDINLIENIEQKAGPWNKKEPESSFTIGDIIKVKKR